MLLCSVKLSISTVLFWGPLATGMLFCQLQEVDNVFFRYRNGNFFGGEKDMLSLAWDDLELFVYCEEYPRFYYEWRLKPLFEFLVSFAEVKVPCKHALSHGFLRGQEVACICLCRSTSLGLADLSPNCHQSVKAWLTCCPAPGAKTRSSPPALGLELAEEALNCTALCMM